MDNLTLIFLVFILFLINYFINSNNSEDFCQCFYYNNNKDNFCKCAYKKTNNIENYKIDYYTTEQTSEKFQNTDYYTTEQTSEKFQNELPFQSTIRDNTNNNYFNYIFGNPKI
jgi:hypothetical protein